MGPHWAWLLGLLVAGTPLPDIEADAVSGIWASSSSATEPCEGLPRNFTARRLDTEEEDCKAKYDVKLKITVFTNWNEQSDAELDGSPKNELFEQSSKAIFVTVLRAMMKNNKDQSSMRADDFKSSDNRDPISHRKVVYPYHGVDGDENDWGARYHRLVYEYTFRDLKSCKAREAVENLCVLLNTEEEVLQLALVRALDTCKLHPSDMISEAGKIKDGSLKTLIHVQPRVLKQDGSGVPGTGCYQSRPPPGTAEGAFYLPKVPDNAVRDSNTHKLDAQCIEGYDGKIDVVSYGAMFTYSGACVPKRGYCPRTLEDPGAVELGETGGYELVSLKKCYNRDIRLQPQENEGEKQKRWPTFGLPEMYQDGRWRPICGRDFTERSATLFCRVLGFRQGTFKRLDSTFGEDAIYIGECSDENGATSVSSCNGMIASSVSGECTAGKHVAIEITCAGGPCDKGQCEPSSCPRLKASINDNVRPTCKPGYKASGQAVCTKGGTWQTSKDFGCEYILPKAPPVPVCSKPDNQGGSRQIIGCEQCRAEKILGEEESGHHEANCHCEVKCSPGYLFVAGEKETTTAACVWEEFRCPAKEDLEWKTDGVGGEGTCFNKDTGELAGHNWCCDEAWGESPPRKLKQQNCRGLSRNMCLQSKEDDEQFESQACCWRLNKFEGGEQCAPIGDETQITDEKQPDACAVPPKVPNATWPQLPKCEKTCNYTNWDENLLDVKGCQDCLPKETHKLPCDCQASCPKGFLKVGNIEEGDKTCLPDLTFGPAPTCLRQKKLTCEKPKGSHWNAPDCKECTFEDSKVCKCYIGCDKGFRSLKGDEGEKTCEKVDASNDLTEVQTCKTLKSVEECMKSKQASQGETDPCGWIGEAKEDGVHCVAQSDPQAGSSDFVLAPVEKAVWKDLPECRPICINLFAVDTKLTHKNCDNCAPGVPCDCDVDCNAAAGYFPVSVGPLPGKRECSYSGEKGEQVKFGPPPTCVRKCESPSDAKGTLVVNGCDDCLEGQVDCKCDVVCAEGNFHVENTGSEGQKMCTALNYGGVGFTDLPKCSPQCEVPGDQYRTLDVSRCNLPCEAGKEGCNCYVECFGEPSEGENGNKECSLVPGENGEAARGEWAPIIPSCLSPIWLKVNNAATGRPMSGVNVILYSDEKRTRALSSAKTDKDGIVWFHTSLPKITFSTDNGDDWVNAVRVLDRVKNCQDPRKCGGQVAISQRMHGADLELENDGCFFTGSEWSMRVVLEWDQTPSDLDLWGRWVHPDADGGSEWVKFSNKEGRPMVSCYSYGWITPECLPASKCHFSGPLWSRSCIPINIERRPEAKLVLDVDKRQGYGPETLSFSGVFAGYYQIVINRYGSFDDVREGNPRIQIYLGGRSTQFKCEMSPSCTKSSFNWQAVNIWITEAGEKDGEPRYQVRLLHTEDEILKPTAGELGVREEIYAETMCHGECWADMYNPEFERCLGKANGQAQSRGSLAWVRRLANSTE